MTNDLITEARLEKIRARSEAATPGPWASQRRSGGREITLTRDHWEIGEAFQGGLGLALAFGGDGGEVPNADFIAHARSDVPALLAEIDRLKVRLAELEQDREDTLTLRRTLAWILHERRDGCDIDGGALQDEFVRLGVIVPTEVEEPCGGSCYCAEYDRFPQVCMKYGPVAVRAIDAARSAEGTNG